MGYDWKWIINIKGTPKSVGIIVAEISNDIAIGATDDIDDFVGRDGVRYVTIEFLSRDNEKETKRQMEALMEKHNMVFKITAYGYIEDRDPDETFVIDKKTEKEE